VQVERERKPADAGADDDDVHAGNLARAPRDRSIVPANKSRRNAGFIWLHPAR
jgi:hypothetical protein